MRTARRSQCCAACWKRSRARLRRRRRPWAARRNSLHGEAAMSADALEPRRRVAVREALAAKRNVVVVVRKRRSRLRWIAGVSLLTWLPFGALALVAGQPDAPGVWIGQTVLALGALVTVSATVAVYVIER